MRLRDDESNLDGILIALAAGIGIGFGLGILLAPNSGTKTRKAIARSASDAMDQIKDKVDDIRSSASDLVDTGKRAMEGHKEVIAQAVEGTKKLYRDAIR